MEPFYGQADLQTCILNNGHGKLVGCILQVRVVNGEDSVAHLQHIAPLGRTGGNYVLNKHPRDLGVAADVDLVRVLNVVVVVVIVGINLEW